MFRKIVAVTLALIVMLQPAMASAATWSSIMTAIHSTGSYSGGNASASKAEDGTVTVTGEVEFADDGENGIYEGGSYVFNDVTATGHMVLHSQNGKLTVVINGGTIEDVNISAHEGGEMIGKTYVTSSADVSGQVFVYAGGEGYVAQFTNSGKLNEVEVVAEAGASASLSNAGTVAGSINAWASGENSEASVANSSQVDGSVYMYGEDGASASNVNTGTIAGEMTVQGYGDADVTFDNGGEVGHAYIGTGDTTTSNVSNSGSINTVHVEPAGGAEIVFNNSGEIADSIVLVAHLQEGTTTKLNNTGDVNHVWTSVRYLLNGEGAAAIPSEEELVAMTTEAIKINGIEMEEPVYIEFCLYEGGEYDDYYLVDAEGNLILVDPENDIWEWDRMPGAEAELEAFVEEEEEDVKTEAEEEISAYDYYAEKAKEEEALRQSRAVGGVTTSIFWNYQMYLGHSTYNGRVYYQGEKELTFQSLNWLPDGTKNYTLRINKSEPAAADVEIRVAQDILDVCKRAGISTITLVDKENNPIAQYAVADLIAAREMYGLAADELLCISADANAEVMKVTSAGEYVPIEPETEEKTAG